jgi:hypothetical protein
MYDIKISTVALLTAQHVVHSAPRKNISYGKSFIYIK